MRRGRRSRRRLTAAQALAITAAVGLGGCGRAPIVGEGVAADAAGGAGGAGNGAGGAGNGAGGMGSSSIDVNCGSITKQIQPTPPDVLLLLDKSGSMNNDPDDNACVGGCGTSSKWALVTAAIDQVVATTDSSVNWGLKLFATTNSGCAVGGSVEVPVAPANAGRVMSAIAGATVGSSTPTRLAESAGVAYLETLTDPNPRYLLLATDGLPNCDPALPSMTTADDSAGAAAAVAAALASGFPTFVVGIGNTMAEATLNQLALGGGEPQMGAATAYYQISDTAGLVAALRTILGSVSCTFDLGAPPNELVSNEAIEVLHDGVLIPRDITHANGWDYLVATAQIKIYGPTCDAIMAGAVGDVTILFRCVD